MASPGADVIVCHLGLTAGGSIGAETTYSLDDCVPLVTAWPRPRERSIRTSSCSATAARSSPRLPCRACRRPTQPVAAPGPKSMVLMRRSKSYGDIRHMVMRAVPPGSPPCRNDCERLARDGCTSFYGGAPEIDTQAGSLSGVKSLSVARRGERHQPGLVFRLPDLWIAYSRWSRQAHSASGGQAG